MHLWRIQQASSAYCSGVEIPVEMFSDWLTLRPYLAKVVQAQKRKKETLMIMPINLSLMTKR